MKLSKFVKRAKSESYCVVIHADDSGIWLGTRLALYNATELPYMEGKEQAGAVLDIDSKAWEKMFFDEKYTAHAGADFGMNLTETDPTEQEARRVPLEMFYKGIDEHTVVRLSLRSMFNPELRYFFAYEEVYQEQKQEITAMLKRRNITKREVDSVYGIAEVGRQ